MGINWITYINAAVSDVSKNLNIEITTRKVDKDRLLNAGKILPKIKKFELIQILEDRALIYFDIANESHLAYYAWNAQTVAECEKIAENAGFPRSKPDAVDALFLYLAKEFHLQVRPDLVSSLAQCVGLERHQDKSTVDFDLLRSAHGELLIWNASDVKRADASPLSLLTGNVNGSTQIHYSSSSSGLAYILAGQCPVVNLSDLCRSLMSPICSALDKPLQTAAITIKAEEVERALGISISLNDVALCVGGGACFSFTSAGQEYFAISLRNTPTFAQNALSNLLREEFGLRKLVHGNEYKLGFLLHLPGAVQLKAISSSEDTRWLEDRVSFNSDESNNLQDLLELYDEILVACAEDERINPIRILAQLSVQFDWARSPFIPSSVVNVARELLLFDEFPFENIYLSLSASHWKHSFLEIYRVVEGLYYFGWMKALKAKLSAGLSEHALAKICEVNISWKFDEKASITELFSLIPQSAFSFSPATIKCLEDRIEADGSMRRVGGVIYSIRNSNIHQAKIDDAPVEVSAECWPKLTLLLFEVVRYFYKEHSAGMPKGKLTRFVGHSNPETAGSTA